MGPLVRRGANRLAGASFVGTLAFVSWLEQWEWALPVILMLFFLPLLFPDGKPISPRWWLLAPLVLLGFGLAMFGIYVGQLMGLVGSVLANVSLFIRYRRTDA